MSAFKSKTDGKIKNRESLGESVRVSLRDQIPNRLKKQLNDIDAGKVVVDIWHTGNSDRVTWLQRQKDFLTHFDDFIDNSKTVAGPWTDSSNLHLPIVLTAGKALHARILDALLGFDPPFQVLPMDEAATIATPLVEGVMSYAIKEWANDYEGVEEVMDRWLWDWIFKGVGILKLRWERKFTRYVDVREELKRVREMQEVEDPNTGEITTQIVPMLARVEVEVPITEMTFNGPMMELVNPEDLLIVGGDGDPQKADGNIHRYFLTRSELYTLADQEIFDLDAVEETLNGGHNAESGDVTDGVAQAQEINSGVQKLDTEADLDRYEILEAHIKLDVNNDGIDEDVIIWVNKDTHAILRSTYRNRVFKGGKIPFVKIDFMKRQNSTYGMGLAEMLDPLAREIDAMHNIRIDYGILSTMPFGFYRAGSSLEPKTIQLEPGALIPLDDPQRDVFFPNLGAGAAFPAAEEASLIQTVERLTSISDLNLGVVGGSQGAARTATGVSILAGENNANLSVFIRRMNRGWRQALRILFQMLQQRIPDGLSIRITGDDGAGHPFKVDRQDIQFKFDFALEPNSANSNRSITQQVAQQTMQMTLNPLLIQTGVVSVENIYQAVKNWLQAMGIKNTSTFITKPQNQHIFMSPQEEFQRVAKGVPVPVHPAMNHEGFIAFAAEILSDPEKLGFYQEDAVLRVARQADEHKQMLDALKQQDAQVRNVSQQQINSQTAADGEVPLIAPQAEGANQGG